MPGWTTQTLRDLFVSQRPLGCVNSFYVQVHGNVGYKVVTWGSTQRPLRRNAHFGATPRERPNGPPTIMNCDTTTSYSEYLKVKEVGKQSNPINLYYLNFLGTVMLRPLLVILGSGA
jgi:hypothetical protein